MVTAFIILAGTGAAFLGIAGWLLHMGWHPEDHPSIIRRHDREMLEG